MWDISLCYVVGWVVLTVFPNHTSAGVNCSVWVFSPRNKTQIGFLRYSILWQSTQ